MKAAQYRAAMAVVAVLCLGALVFLRVGNMTAALIGLTSAAALLAPITWSFKHDLESTKKLGTADSAVPAFLFRCLLHYRLWRLVYLGQPLDKHPASLAGESPPALRKMTALPRVSVSKLSWEPTPIGEGGEARVYPIPGGLFVFKKYHQEDELTDVNAKREAGARLRLMQTKLRSIPASLPNGVIAPTSVVVDEKDNIVGILMPFVPHTCTLQEYMNQRLRAKLPPDAELGRIFQNLWKLIRALHQVGVIVGDLNPRNVLIQGTDVFLCDFDACQFGSYNCRSYTSDYLCPLFCDPTLEEPVLKDVYDETQDIYAFNVMLFEACMGFHPFFEGIQKRDAGLPIIRPRQRPMKGMSVFHPAITANAPRF